MEETGQTPCRTTDNRQKDSQRSSTRGKDYVEPGELILAKVDIALGNDITAPLAIKAFQEAGAKRSSTGSGWCW